MRVLVDSPASGTEEAGFLMGSAFYFAPAGEDGDRHEVEDATARAVMGDAGLAVHFECTPPIETTPATPVPDPAVVPMAEVKDAEFTETVHEPAGDAKAGGRRRKGATTVTHS
jgi:hypothetical protein